MAEINVGDVVQMKSDGPLMTVTDVGDYSSSGGPEQGVNCEWFENADVKSRVFNLATLNKRE